MQESWIPLQCIDCETDFEYSPSDLPPVGSEFTCENCGSTRSISEFVQTKEGLDILESFHGQ